MCFQTNLNLLKFWKLYYIIIISISSCLFSRNICFARNGYLYYNFCDSKKIAKNRSLCQNSLSNPIFSKLFFFPFLMSDQYKNYMKCSPDQGLLENVCGIRQKWKYLCFQTSTVLRFLSFLLFCTLIFYMEKYNKWTKTTFLACVIYVPKTETKISKNN